MPQALSGITGRKGCVGGDVSPSLNLWAQPKVREDTASLEDVRGVRTLGVGVKSVDI